MVHAKTTIKMTPSSQKSAVAQFSEKGTENKSEVQNTTLPFESGTETLSSETNITMTPSAGRKSMVSQFSKKKTENESKVQDTVNSESETTIIMTPSSQKSMVAHFLEKETENNDQDTTVSVGTESETIIAKTPSSQKSMIAQFLKKGTENDSRVYDTKISVASDLRSETTTIEESTIEITRPSSRKSMVAVAQSLKKGTGNESDFQDITVSGPSESETLHSETTMTQSSRKSMVSQSLENKAEDQISPDAIETVEEYEARIQGNRD